MSRNGAKREDVDENDDESFYVCGAMIIRRKGA